MNRTTFLRLLASRTLAAALACLSASVAWAASPGAKAFDTPEQAAEALIAAAAADDVPAMLAIVGPEGKDLIVSADAVQDKKGRAEFVRLAREKTTVEKDPDDPRRATLSVGEYGWPGPVPIVETNGKWSFDAKQGRDEILDRKIGSNELDAIAVCRGFAEAQQEYAAVDRDGDGVTEYAQRILSTPGKKDGLYWKNAEGEEISPIGEGVARALAEGYRRTDPYHGYNFRVLTAQGPGAPLGAMDFVIQGNMIGGFALVAWPAQYRVTGVQTFLVGYDGVVYQQDLGPETAKAASGIRLYDPGKGWTVTEDEAEPEED